MNQREAQVMESFITQDERNREKALTEAVHARVQGDTPEDIVKRAKAFYEFLSKDSSTS